MEELSIIRSHQKETFMPYSTPSPSPPPSLSMHRDSQTISKPKPKIRIIHIFAPEIIKTDVENFRELVQRLTGKPAHDQKKRGSCRGKKVPRIPRRAHQERGNDNDSDNNKKNSSSSVHERVEAMRSTGFLGLAESCRERVKEEEGEEGVAEETMWSNNNGESMNSGGYLNGFTDFDGFIQELGEFPLIPMHAFEETTQLA